MGHPRRTLGQILFAIGLTLALGGLASFAFANVELRFFDIVITLPEARVAWTLINGLIAAIGLLLWRLR